MYPEIPQRIIRTTIIGPVDCEGKMPVFVYPGALTDGSIGVTVPEVTALYDPSTHLLEDFPWEMNKEQTGHITEDVELLIAAENKSTV